MPPLGAIGGAISAASTVGGAISGAMGNRSSTSLGPGTALELQGSNLASQQLGFLGNQGIQNVEGRQAELDELLRQLRETGGLPSGTDIRQARQTSQNLFQGQRNALQDQFRQQLEQGRQRGAQLGRSSADPVLNASLAESQGRQLQQLEANRGALESQIALQAPERRLGFETQRLGLAQQAFSNRAALASLGSQISQGQQALRSRQSQSGGGLGGAITGAIGGLGGGIQIFNRGNQAGLFG